jgi:acyl transferase domain-containing protein/acyl carrier protein
MQSLPTGGAMIAINTTEHDIQPYLSDTVALAAVNTTDSVVISGDAEDVHAVAHHFAKAGTKTRHLAVSHAFHSPHMDPILNEFRTAISALTFHLPAIPVVSTLTGQLTGAFTADYWTQQLRSTVRFADAVQTLHDNDVTAYLELGPEPALSPLVGTATAIAVQRSSRDQATQLITALAQAHNHGIHVDWTTIHTGQRTSLPTYPFQHQSYWLHPRPHTNIAATGLTTSDHPLLTALIEPAGTTSLILAGRISVGTHPWLADHSVLGATLLAGTAYLDMALHAAELAGCDLVEELALETPLVLPTTGAVQIQVSVQAPDDAGRRTIAIHSRPDDATPEPETVWVRHAAGSLAADTYVEPAFSLQRPTDAEPVDVTDAYDRLAGQGYHYGPVFQGLQAVWWQQDDCYAEASIPDGTSTAGHTIHPALLDAVLHSLAMRDNAGQLALPFAWRGVRLYARDASTLRARISSGEGDSFGIELSDAQGRPVAVVESLLTRPVTADLLAAAGNPARDALFELRWDPVAAPVVAGDPGVHNRIADFAPAPIGDVVEAARASVTDALAQLQDWITGDHAVDGRLAIVTHNGVSVGDNDIVNLAHATVWGLVRSAQNEHPGQFVLIDIDEDGQGLVHAALETGESQLAIRNGQILTPRLVSAPRAPTREMGINPGGTVLITGGTGTLGGLIARHLVTTHGARHLLLTSRRGGDAEGTAELTSELTGLGAIVTVIASDTADSGQLATLLADIPAEHPLTAVIHTAGVVDDALITDLTPARLNTVLRPKVDAAWNLHQQTRHLDLAAFVLYSSVSGTLGSAGQANYASANAFLDALAHHRRTHNLPATALSWGLWERTSAMTEGLDQTNLSRIRRTGIVPLHTQDALALFDTALSTGRPHLVAARIDRAVLRAQADSGALPALLRGIIRTSRKTAGPRHDAGWAKQLAAMPDNTRYDAMLDLVRREVADVLAHPASSGIDPDRGFLELGFDSLTAVELRNQLTAATGLRLGATIIFDHPTPASLAHYLKDELAPSMAADNERMVLAELDKLEAAVPAMAEHARLGIAQRLQELGARLSTKSTGDTSPVERVHEATDEELFDFIDNEL